MAREAGVYIDGYVGIAIGLFIIKSSIEVFKESISKIIGERSESELNKELIEEISQIDDVLGVYDLIINNYGNDKNIASVHIEVKDSMTAKEIQILERKIAGLCYSKYKTIMTIGIYAQNEENDEAKIIKSGIDAILKEYPQVIQSHGYYCDFAQKLISIDIIIDFDTKNEEEIYAEIKSKIEKANEGFTINIVLDRDFAVS